MKTLFRIAACTLVASAIAPQTGLAQSDLIRTAKSQFRIPFAFEREQYAKIGAQEVQLFLSMDKGENWQHVQSALPTAQKFRYKATREGEHWFAVRTLDRNRQLHPAGKLTPGLKVLVDTSKPEVALQLKEGPGDSVLVSWVIEDIDIDLSSLRIECKDDVTGEWRKPKLSKSPQGTVEVKVPNSALVTARLGVQDRAGNIGVVERRLRRGPVAAAPSASSLTIPDSVPDEGVTKVQYSAPAIAGPRFRPQPQIRPQPEINPLPAPTAPEQVGLGSVTVAPPVPGAPKAAGTLPATTVPVQSVTAQQVIGPLPSPSPGVMKQPMQSQPIEQAPPLSTDEVPIFSFDSEEDVVSGQNSSTAEEVDPLQPRIVNQLQFRLDYAIEDLGPSGVSAVEVYITEDGGKKWWRYGEDMDKKSPVILRVPRDGKYGFVIGVRNGVGVGDAPPRSGDAPHALLLSIRHHRKHASTRSP